MKFIPTFNELALSCLVAYTVAKKEEDNEINSMIKKASRSKDSCVNPTLNLQQGISMEVSMNSYDTVFIRFNRKIYGSSFQHLAEIIYNKDGEISVRGEDTVSESVKVMLLSQLEK